MIKIYYTDERYNYLKQSFYIDEKTFKIIGLKIINKIAANEVYIQTKKVNIIEGMFAKLCLKRTSKLDDVLYHNYHYLSIKEKHNRKKEEKKEETVAERIKQQIILTVDVDQVTPPKL